MLLVIIFLTIQTLAAQPGRFGLPACSAPTQQLLSRSRFVLCFDSAHKLTLWAAYQLTPEMLAASAAPRQHFRRDPDLAASATDADYRNSGLHRSHLVPAADLAANSEALRESYLLSNAVPQLPSLNLSQWRKIENDIRKLAARSDALYILTGVLLDCEIIRHIGPNQIAVPCATYKAVLAVNSDARTTYAVVLPNEPNATRQTVTIREIEHRAHLDFFASLPRAEQDAIESSATSLR